MKHIKKIFPLLSLFFLNAAVFAQPYYFENPSAFSSTSNSYFPKTISNAEGADKCLVFYEEAEPQKNELALYVRKSSDGYNWEEKKLIADKISYQFSVPNIFSCAYSGGIYALAFLKNESTISVITSKNAFETFKEHEIKNVTSTRVAPRIFANGKEGFILFVSEAKGEDFLIKYSLSKDGASWADFLAIDTSTLSNVGNPLVPYYVAGKNSSILLFIAQYHKSGLISLQIFSTVSKTNGRTWEKINLLTDEKIADNNKFDNYSNQSPYLFYDGKNFNLVWERSSSSFLNPDIYYAVLDENAKIKGGAEKVSTSGFSNHPTLFMYKEKLHLLWFVNQSGNKRVYLSHKDGMLWSEPESLSPSSCVYPSFILNGKDNGLSFVWQKEFLASKTSSVEILRSDHSVKPPKIMGSNFKNKDRGALSNISAVISPEDDSSGIKGLSWIFTSDEKEEPPLEISAKPVTEKISAEITKDGVHYFKVKQTDFAGNWSDTVSICYESDKTPPLGVKANDLLLDVSETLVSNTFKITWTPDSRDDDIAGYSYMLKKIDDIPPPLVSNKYHPMRITEDEALDLRNELVTKNEAALDEDVHLSAKIITKNPAASFTNIRNGLYAFYVAAIDTSGNLSEDTECIYFCANKYIPSTYISEVIASTDDFGDSTFEINGSGFTYDGKITEIYLFKDSVKNPEYTFRLSNNDYRIASNYRIDSLNISLMKSGIYGIALRHSDRGLYVSNSEKISIEEYGTVKSKIAFIAKPIWKFFSQTGNRGISITKVIIFMILLFALIASVVSARLLASSVKETI
ncbi:MAG: hypothetical protein J6Z17_03045, partial [Treponema sp.]|nr:hypothetical protein [Treponema sp.]